MIGYYAHHHGAGHLANAACLAAALAEPVVLLTSAAVTDTAPFDEVVALTADPPLAAAQDPRAGGALHWSPLNSPGYSRRMAQLAAWVQAAGPRLVVVDLSVEVTALLRLLGVPVVAVTAPGCRDDDAHRFGFAAAARVVAPWPRAVLDPAHLAPLAGKTSWIGALSRYDGRDAPAAPGGRRVLLLLGAGGDDVTTDEVDAAAAATPGWSWRALGGGAGRPWTPDVWTELGRADVVVAHAGLGLCAEIAAARRPAVLVAQARPFGEQHDTAAALDRAGIAAGLPAWPPASDWPGLLDAAVRRGGAGWARWNDGGAAQRFAEVVRDVRVGARRPAHG